MYSGFKGCLGFWVNYKNVCKRFKIVVQKIFRSFEDNVKYIL